MVMQTTPCKRMFPQFLSKQRTSVNVQDIEELSLVELLEADVDHTSQQESQNSLPRPSLPGAQAYVNRLLVRVKQNANLQKIRLTPGLTSHSFRRGGAMHANNGTVAENWIIERGGWQLDRVNKAFGYMLGTTQADQQVSRVLSGWEPKEGARLPSLSALENPILGRAMKMKAVLFASTVTFSDQSLNLDEDVADALVATLFLHYPDMLRFCDSSPFVVKMREAMVVRSIGESEVLAWSSTIRREFIPASQPSTSPSDDSDRLGVVLKLVQRQTEQISVLILQGKQLEERLLAVEDKLHTPSGTTTQEDIGSNAAPSVYTEPYSQPPPKAARAKRKGSQSLAAMWFEWFTAELRVYASKSIKKTALYELRHIAGYLMLFLPTGFALGPSSPAFKSEVLVLGKQAQGNALAFLKKHGSSAVAAGTALKALRKIHKLGKLNDHIAQYHDRLDQGAVVDPTPSAALPAFIRVKPSQ